MPSPITILFDAYHLYHLPQFDPVIDLLTDDERFDVHLSYASDILSEEQKLAGEIISRKSSQVITAETEEERAAKIRVLAPDVFICGWSRYEIQEYVPDSTLVGMIYHGIGVKPSYWRDNHPRLDLRFVEGPFRERKLREEGVETDLALTGFAKLDPLFNHQIPDQKTLLDQLDLDPDKKTILYAPTFYPSSLESFDIRLAQETEDFNLIIKLHMWAYFNTKFPINLKGQLRLSKEMERKFEHVHLLPPEYYNITPLYSAADVLLTEASSTIYEMMALDKPVIVCEFYRLRMSHKLFRKRLYIRRMDEEMSKEMVDFCIKLDNPRNLKPALDQAFTGEDPYVGQRKKYKAEMLYKLDGKASERIRDTILEKLGRVHSQSQ